MGLDYSQKRLVSAPLRHHGRRTHDEAKLQVYAFWTGLASTLISLVGVLVQAFKGH